MKNKVTVRKNRMGLNVISAVEVEVESVGEMDSLVGVGLGN